MIGLLGDEAEETLLGAALGPDPGLRLHRFLSVAACREKSAGAAMALLLVSAEQARRHRAELFGPSVRPAVAVFAAAITVDEAVTWMRAGAVDCFALAPENLAGLPARLRAAFGRPRPGANRNNRDALARKLAVVVEKVGDGLTLCDENGRFRIFNRQMRRITGYSRSMAGSHAEFLHLLHPEPEEHRRAEERLRAAVATGEIREAEAVVRTRSGEFRVLSVIVSPVRVGGQVWVLGAYRDVTARKQAETVLEQRESRSLRFNHALASLTGSERLFHGDRRTALRLITQTAARALAVARVGVWFLDPVRGELCCADLFEQSAGRHSEGQCLAPADYPAYFTALFTEETIAAGDALSDPTTREFADTYLRPLGIGSMLDVPIRFAGQVVGVVCHEHIGEARPWSAAEQAFASAIGSCVSLVLEAGARRQAEDAQKSDHDRLHEIIEFLPDATFVVDRAGVVTAWNKAMEELTGMPKAGILKRGDREYSVPVYGDRREMLIDYALHAEIAPAGHYELFTREGSTVYGESRIPRLAGTGRPAYLWGSARPLYNQAGEITGAIESIRDVTNRKLTENEVVSWKKRYELVAAASGQITYEYNLASGFILWSESVDRVLGYGVAELGSHLRSWLRLIHPEDRRATAANLHRSLRGSTPYDVEYRMRHKEGSYLWFRHRGYYIMTADGVRSMIGMLTDVSANKQAVEALLQAHILLEDRVQARTSELATANARLREEIAERERAQQALTTSERKYRLMVDSLPQVVYELDLEGNVVLLNREGFKSARFGTGEIRSGVNLFQLVHPRDHARLRANWQRLLAGHPVNGEEYLFVRSDGTTFPGTSYAQVIAIDGRPAGVTGFLIDETRRKQAEESLRRAHADLEDRVVQRTGELAESNASLRQLLAKQEMNVELAHQVLLLVNADPPRNSALPEGLGLFTAAQSIPRYLQGGDHFLSRRIDGPAGPRTLVSLKDQSGHEVGCILRSIITDLVHNALLTRAGAQHPLPQIVTRLNREICRCHLFSDGDFFTALDLELDHATLEMEYVVAGHPPFLLVRGADVQLVPALAGAGTNLPVGMIEHHQYSSARLQLQPGDKLILYTDGLLEAPALRGQPNLTSAHLAEIAQRLVAADPGVHAVPLAQELFRTIAGVTCDEAVAAHVLPDDVAIFVLEVERPGPCFEDCLQPGSLDELCAQRRRLTATIEEEWRTYGITASPMRLHLVLEEALYNAWHHGNRCSPAKRIVVRRRYGNDARIEVVDEGDGFVVDRVGDPTSHENRVKPSGRGLFMIRRFADEARWSDGGRHLTLFFGDEKTFVPPGGRSPLPRINLWQSPPAPPVFHTIP